MKQFSITIALIAALVLAAPGMAFAAGPNEPSTVLKIVDAVLVRPVTIVTVPMATALALVIMPFAAPFGEARDIGRDMVVGSWDFAVTRPLGDFSN